VKEEIAGRGGRSAFKGKLIAGRKSSPTDRFVMRVWLRSPPKKRGYWKGKEKRLLEEIGGAGPPQAIRKERPGDRAADLRKTKAMMPLAFEEDTAIKGGYPTSYERLATGGRIKVGKG